MAPRNDNEQAATPVDMQRHAMGIGMLAAFVVIGVYLSYRNFGLNPAIFADEWYYSKMARLMELKDAIVPSYLYLWLFRGTTACGAQFLECARAANVVLFLAGAPFIYLVARQFAGRWPAALVALLSMLAPINVFTAYFMPEATYYFGFWVLSWIALTRSDWDWARHALATGTVLGLMTLVKVHAVFLLPALCLYLLYACWNRGGPWLASGLLSMLVAAATVVAIRFGLGYLLVGDAGLSLLGPFYQGAANSAGDRSILSLLPPAVINARGHLMALAILLGLPLALLAYNLVTRAFRERGDRGNLLYLYTLLMLGAAAGLTVLFTASLAAPENKEGLRLHLRYYSFMFPLLWIVAAAAVGKEVPARHGAWRWTIAVVLAAMLAMALFTLPAYQINPVDAIELFSVGVGRRSSIVFVALGLIVLLLWAMRKNSAASLFLYVLAPALLAAGLVASSAYLEKHEGEQAADKAGKFARSYVPDDERSQIVVAGTDLSQLMRAQFHIDHKDTSVLELAPGQPIARHQIPIYNKWLLVIGPHALPDDIKPVATHPNFVLVKIDTGRLLGHVLFSGPLGTGLIASAEGLSGAEHWGRWSDAKQVVLHFNEPLPKRLNVTLQARAFADNTEKEFTMRVGDEVVPFRLSWGDQQVGMRFKTDGTQRTLTIDVPHPVSPKELGQGGDERKLGIGLVKIEIGTSGEAATANNP